MAASRNRVGAVTLLALVGVVALAWLAWPRERTEVAPSVAPSLQEDRVAEGERAEPTDVGNSRAEVTGPVRALEPLVQVAVDPDASPQETWVLWGTLVRASDGTPAPDLRVGLGPELVATSDARGRFELELQAQSRPRGSRWQVSVTHASGTVLLEEERALEIGMVLRVDDDVVWLHGLVVDGLGAPVVADGVALACEFGEGRGRLLGRPGECDAEGRFRFAVRGADLGCDSVTLQLWLARTRYPVSTTLAALRSEAGATVVLDVCPLTIELRASDGGELVDPDLRLVAWRSGAEHAQLQSFPELEHSLDVELFLERGVERIEIAAGADGCAPWIMERDAPRCGSTLRIELQRLGPDDVIEGVVLDAGGNPVPLAYASCSPPSHDREMVAVPAIRGVRTHVDGRFSLPFAAGKPARVMAYHWDFGSTGEQLVQGGRRDLVLRFRPVARLDVRLFTPDGEEPGAEPTRFVLALADGSLSVEIGTRGRASLEEVPLGSHTLVCVSGDERWWGLFEVDVYETGPQEVRRTLSPARWVEGSLVGTAGTPLADVEVRLQGAPLVNSPEWNPFVAHSNAEGHFRVLIGSETAADLAFVRDGLELARTRLTAGDAGNVALSE